MNAPQDQKARTRFATELARNFSVVASAGSGKTRAITKRIAQLAQASDALETLPRLVVLTFANRSADEMQQRAREEILRANPRPESLAAFNRAWFGTIHSFCFKLLNEYGHYLGLPAPLELLADDEDLWTEFVQQQMHVGRSLSKENRTDLLRLVPLRKVMELGRRAQSALLHHQEPGTCPRIVPTPILEFPAGANATQIRASQARLKSWDKTFWESTGFVALPVCSAGKGSFKTLWDDTFIPLRRWVNKAAVCVAAEVQRDYRNFRIERGVVTFDDQIALADELLQHPEAARRLRQLDPIVILDEAQDTDPAQFSVLLEITRPPEATGRWLQTGEHPPRPGRFCMVGDFQQSIWSDRADLKQYRRVHNALVNAEAGDSLTFSVTFRLDQKQIDFINATFQHILNETEGQEKFVTLQPQPTVLPGQVIGLCFGESLLGGDLKQKDRKVAQIEAREIAAWLKRCGPEKLRARSWRHVAILCPRKDWLNTMADELRHVGLPVEMQSEADKRIDSPAYAWLTALCTIMVEPQNHYEIVGVLREVYGLSDHDLATFAEGDGARFQIETATGTAGNVGSPLAELAAVRAAVLELPLYSAVEQIIARTALRARIAILPPGDFKEPLAELDVLLTHAAQLGAAGARLVDFADRLRSEMESSRPVRLSDQNAIQLITAHKAKGLEWDAIIVPFLGRRISNVSPRYPSVFRVPGSDEIIAALHKEDREKEIKAAYDILRRQEMERLLYVALTRARHTLVLALDRSLFAPATGRVADCSQLDFLRGNAKGVNLEVLEALETKPEPCATTAASWEESAARADLALPEETPLRASAISRARANAAVFIRKQSPSDAEDPVETPLVASHLPRSLMDNPATRYGSWWHALFQRFPWKEPTARWPEAFRAFQVASPDPVRAEREWELFQVAARAPVFQEWLGPADAVFQTEFPILWSMNEGECVEGLVDLLLVHPQEKRGLLIDWKTNQVSARDLDGLRLRYRPQMAAYWQAVRAITGLDLQAALYSTATGRLLLFAPDELA